jgi:sugar phosphate isomerase/epimerase
MQWSLATIVLAPRAGAASDLDPAERREQLAWAAAAGFEAAEISSQWLDVLRSTDQQLSKLRADVADTGLAVSGININRCILTRTDRAAEHLALIRRAIHAAGILGAPLVNISLSMPRASGGERPVLRGCDVPDTEHRQSAALVAGLADEAAALGVALSLELHDDGLLDTADLCLRMLERVARANVGVNPDLGNLCRSAGPDCQSQRALAQLAPHANCWHVKNYRGGEPAPLWDGDVDYARAVRTMLSAGFDGPVSIEGYFGDVLAAQADGLAWLKKVAAAATLESSGRETKV